MTSTEITNKARLRDRETPESLEIRFSRDGVTLTYGDRILVAGFYWNGPGMPSYFGAVYEALNDEPMDTETDLELVATSDKFFEDAGHAIEWAMKIRHL